MDETRKNEPSKSGHKPGDASKYTTKRSLDGVKAPGSPRVATDPVVPAKTPLAGPAEKPAHPKS